MLSFYPECISADRVNRPNRFRADVKRLLALLDSDLRRQMAGRRIRMNQWRISTVCSFLCLAGLLGCRPNIEKTEAEVPAVESQPTTSEIRILASEC